MMELCRICLSENTDKDVFSLPNELKVQQTVQEVMMFCLNIELCEDSKFDTFLCENCHSSIISFYKFKVLALQSDEHLKSILQCKTEDKKGHKKENKKDDKLSYESGPDEAEIKQENDEFVVKCEKFDQDSDDNFLAEFTFLIDAPEENEDHTTSKKTTRGSKKISPNVKEEKFKKKCKICGKSVKCIKQHMIYMHNAPKEEMPSCNLCNKKVRNLIKHTKRHHNPLKTLPCEFCDNTFGNAKGLEQHMSLHLADKQFFCNDCEMSYYVKIALEMHIRKTHLKERSYKCSRCGATFSRRYHLDRHRLTHIDITPTEKHSDICPVCGKTYRNLKEHLQTHQPKHSRTMYSCKLCDKSFQSKPGLRRHRQFTHYSTREKCTVCSKEVTHLQSHIQRMHSSRPFACKCCPLAFATEPMLRHHMVTHNDDRPFECTHCGNRYKATNALERHVRSIHVGEKRFHCQVCSKGFFSKSHLARHLVSHSDERKYKCDLCPKRLKSAQELRVHMDRHSGVKKLQCAICGMGFVTHSGYSAHKLTHTKEKRHACRFCDVKFGRTDHRNRHERTAHGKQLESLRGRNVDKS